MCPDDRIVGRRGQRLWRNLPFARPLNGVQNRMSFTIRMPRGVICAITRSISRPLNTLAHKVGPALAGGNASSSSREHRRCQRGCYARPAGGRFAGQLLRCCTARARRSAVSFWPDQCIAFYAFTGSTQVDARSSRAAGLRGTQLELGSIAKHARLSRCRYRTGHPEDNQCPAPAKAGAGLHLRCSGSSIDRALPEIRCRVCRMACAPPGRADPLRSLAGSLIRHHRDHDESTSATPKERTVLLGDTGAASPAADSHLTGGRWRVRCSRRPYSRASNESRRVGSGEIFGGVVCLMGVRRHRRRRFGQRAQMPPAFGLAAGTVYEQMFKPRFSVIAGALRFAEGVACQRGLKRHRIDLAT